MTFFLVTTDHLETRLWFRDDEDFKSGMNLVAVTAYSAGVSAQMSIKSPASSAFPIRKLLQ